MLYLLLPNGGLSYGRNGFGNLGEFYGLRWGSNGAQIASQRWELLLAMRNCLGRPLSTIKKLELWEEEITRLILWAQKEWFCDWDSASSAWVSIERDWDAGGQSWIGVNTRVRAAKPDNWSTLLLHGNRGEATYRLLENEQQHRDSDMEMHMPAYPRAPLHHCHLWCTILKSSFLPLGVFFLSWWEFTGF